MGEFCFWKDPPLFFQGPKKRKFYSGANGHFLFCHANSEKPANEHWGKLMGYIVAQVVLTNGRLGFGRTLPNFCRGRQLWATFSTRFGIGRTGRNVENQKHKY